MFFRNKNSLSKSNDVPTSRQENPKILHRVYFDDMPPYKDPFSRFLESWKGQLPEYRIMQWNASNVDLQANEWVRRAANAKSPVFLSEYFRWKVLSEYGGVYLDADCEVLDGRHFHAIVEDLYASSQYDAVVGVEDYSQGHPTAQTMIAKKNSALVRFMVEMYETTLSGPMWHWREIRGLIGPQLISLYFMENGFLDEKGMAPRLDNPVVKAGVKIYPQEYFSPKFAIDGRSLRYTKNTCIYHLFANLNMPWTDSTKQRLRDNPALFHEYVRLLNPLKTIHRIYFGFDGKPDACSAYLETWKTELPDYEIRHWNAENLPMDLNPYVIDLYEKRDHAFLTDYFRWWVLREHGGIYLDADIEIVDGRGLDHLIDELQEASEIDALIGVDNKASGWYTAHSMASKPNSDITKFMCNVYEQMGPIRAWRKKAFYLWAPQLTALYFFENGYHVDGMGTSPRLDYPVVAARVKILPQDYFSPIVPETQANGDLFTINGYTERTVICHHFACSWHDASSPYKTRADGFSLSVNSLLRDLGRIQLGAGVLRPRSDLAAHLLEQGQLAWQSGDGEGAKQFYREAIVAEPANECSWLKLARVLTIQSDYSEAETTLRKALALNDKAAPVHLQLAAVLVLQGFNDEAAVRLKHALRLNPASIDLWNDLAFEIPQLPSLDKFLDADTIRP